MMNPVKITRVLLTILLCIAVFFSAIGTGFSQTLDPALESFIQQTITNSVAATIAFTSTDAISTGSFAFDEGDARGASRFNITRFPFRHFFSRWKDSEYAPFMSGSFGYFEDTEQVLLGNPPDESHFKAFSISLGAGIKLELIKKYLWLIPEIDLIYGQTWNEHQYNSVISNTIIKPVLDGILFNWKVDTWTYAPALQLAFEHPVRVVTFGLDTKFTYLDIRTIKTDYPEQEVRSGSSLWRNRLRFEFPLGISAFDLPLSLRGDFSRVDMAGDVAKPLKESFFYEVGSELAFDTAKSVSWLKSLSIGGSYTFSSRITGWSIRLGYKF
jgi:Solitary outer membrane autotransporter beta-barrel domain